MTDSIIVEAGGAWAGVVPKGGKLTIIDSKGSIPHQKNLKPFNIWLITPSFLTSTLRAHYSGLKTEQPVVSLNDRIGG